MKPDPILEELWNFKDELAREASYDTHRFFEILRQWETNHPHPGPVIKSAEELRDIVRKAAESQVDSRNLLLNDQSEQT